MTEPAPAPRQTLSYLRNLLEERGIKPKNKLGQNFLIDLNLLDFIVRSAELSPADAVLEVGTGTGTLTTRLAEAAGAVLTVEVDPVFQQLAEEVLADRPNVVLVRGDALKTKNELNPEILSNLERLKEERGCSQVKVVANLPYAVATPVISNLLLTGTPIERMVVMVQWEIAERLTAQPSTKDYSALSVLVQSLADVEILRRLPPAVFWPRPLVHSGIVKISPSESKRQHVGDSQRFRNFLRDLYVHRRKNLRGALVGLPNADFSKAEVDARLAELGLEGTTRAEALDLEQHLRLAAVFGPASPPPGRSRG